MEHAFGDAEKIERTGFHGKGERVVILGPGNPAAGLIILAGADIKERLPAL